jgi:Mg2+/citrate symporter
MVNVMPTAAQNGRFLLSGVIAGAASTLVFTAIHHLFISNIWFSLLPMLIAGALCGLCLAWSYGRLFRPRS